MRAMWKKGTGRLMGLRDYFRSRKVPAGVINGHRREFIRTQTMKGLLGLALTFAYFTVIGQPEWSDALAALWLVTPLGLARLGPYPIRMRVLEAASLSTFAVMITFLSALTGGLSSPFLLWLMLVPLEGALAGRSRTVWFAGACAFAGPLVLTGLEVLDQLPASHLADNSDFGYGLSALVAAVQATLIAISAHHRRKVADSAAERGEARYRFLGEHAMDLITSHAADGRVLFASPSSVTLLGYQPDELAGMRMSDLTHPEDQNTMMLAFESAGQHRNAVSAEVRLLRKSGSFVWAELRCRPAGGAQAEGSNVVAVSRDIGERKAQERALIEARDLAEDASRAKSQFLANMSHELRTPLNAIIGFSEVMTREMFGPIGTPRYLEYSRLINESGAHLLALINSILDMSKIEAGRFELALEEFDLEEAANQALRFVSILAERQNIALSIDINPVAKNIFADRRAITQILINLLSNGVKFTPSGGSVRVAASTSGRGVEIAVTDTGRGIPAESLKRLGQPFEQVENAHTRSKEGTGLGLALVRAMAHLHGGTMTLESMVGEGTTVRVLLPRAAIANREVVA